MTLLHVLVLMLPTAPAAAPDVAPKPSLAMFSLEAELAVEPGLARLLTDAVLVEVRRTAAFSRVVSFKEIEALVGLEAQKQLFNCKEDSCAAELAGSLGVDYILTGSLGRVGTSFLLNLKLLDVKRSIAASQVSKRFVTGSEDALLDGVPLAVVELLTPPQLLTPEQVARATPVVAPPAGPDRRLLVGGGAAVAAGLAAAVGALLLSGAGVILLALPYATYVPTPLLEGAARRVVLVVPQGGMVALGVVLAAAALAALASGVGILVFASLG